MTFKYKGTNTMYSVLLHEKIKILLSAWQENLKSSLHELRSNDFLIIFVRNKESIHKKYKNK